MEQQLCIFLFFTGLSPLVLSLPRTYYLIKEAKTWSDAQTYCRATHKDLATIESSGDMIKLKNIAQTQQFASDAWIGLYAVVNEWRWSLANEPVGAVTNWCPSNGRDNPCALITQTCWEIHLCTCTHSFICFDDRLTGSEKYVFYGNSLTWFDAQNYCRTFHTDLASARDATEESLIRGKITQAAWFGVMHDPSASWNWADQTITPTINWLPGQPDNLGNENCASVLNGQISNYQCSVLKAFYCYGITTGQQQMIRLQVQSTADVNKNATMVALLDKIKQKLIEYSLQNDIMVKCRKQPDGKVFHKKIE